ncbi:MAG: Crp/Fnr family transcriptional regulator [Comamonadaceae bacterium]|nr:Crp/Fnr family transcriptional regulator [Comamonadaceae bacterium]
MSKVCESSAQAGFPIRGWFAESPPDFRRDFLALARPKSYPAGSVIFQAGEVGQDVFGVHSGVVTLQSRLNHPDAVLLHMVWPGEWFGTWSVLLGKGRRMSAIARTDVSLLRIPGDDLRALLRRRPQWHAELARDAVYGTDVAMQIAADLLIHNASARCAAVLLRLAGRRWASRPGCGAARRDPRFAKRARDALQRVPEYLQPRREGPLEPWAPDPRLQIVDPERPGATA